jgi:large subunit ribosomal protein L17
MKHKIDQKKLGRPTDQRLAMLNNLVTELFLHGQIKTTEAKAKAAKRVAEKAITVAKGNTLHAKRQIRIIVTNRDAFQKLFEEYVPRFATRNGGYSRIIKLPPRSGDGADMALLALLEE